MENFHWSSFSWYTPYILIEEWSNEKVEEVKKKNKKKPCFASVNSYMAIMVSPRAVVTVSAGFLMFWFLWLEWNVQGDLEQIFLKWRANSNTVTFWILISTNWEFSSPAPYLFLETIAYWAYIDRTTSKVWWSQLTVKWYCRHVSGQAWGKPGRQMRNLRLSTVHG